MSKSRSRRFACRKGSKKLLDQVRDANRLKRYANGTQKTHACWAKRFVLYHNKCHQVETGESNTGRTVTYLGRFGTQSGH